MSRRVGYRWPSTQAAEADAEARLPGPSGVTSGPTGGVRLSSHVPRAAVAVCHLLVIEGHPF